MIDFLRAPWTFVDKLVSLFAVFIIFAWMLKPFFGIIEGRLFPVLTDFTITSSEIAGDFSSDFSGEMTILRGKCDFLGMEAYLQGPERRAPVSFTFLESTKARASGTQYWGPWRLRIDLSDLDNLILISFHQCPYRFWKTKTEFYP